MVLSFLDHWEAVQACKYADKGGAPYVNGVAVKSNTATR